MVVYCWICLATRSNDDLKILFCSQAVKGEIGVILFEDETDKADSSRKPVVCREGSRCDAGPHPPGALLVAPGGDQHLSLSRREGVGGDRQAASIFPGITGDPGEGLGRRVGADDHALKTFLE